MGQERATPPIDREKRKEKQNKRGKGKKEKKKQTQKDRKKVIYNDKNHSCKARNGTACIKPVCVHTQSRTQTHTPTHMHSQVCRRHDKANIAKLHKYCHSKVSRKLWALSTYSRSDCSTEVRFYIDSWRVC